MIDTILTALAILATGFVATLLAIAFLFVFCYMFDCVVDWFTK